MKDHSPLAPEERRKQKASLTAAFGREVAERLKPGAYAFEVIKRVAVGVYNDGFIHAGNLAFLALLALFPFFIVATALATLLGQTESGSMTVATILSQLPPEVARTLREPVSEALDARTGALLWLGALVGLWTATSFIETVREILRRAHGVKYSAPFWEYRLVSIAFILVSVILLMFAFALSLMLRSVQAAIEAWFPLADDVATLMRYFQIVPGVALFATIYALFYLLTPSRYRKPECLKWPGALLITLWWMSTVEVLPWALSMFGGYDLTYGSLGGVMVVLIFFFIIGLGVVAGAELNAALAEVKPTALKGEVYSGPFKDELEVEEPQPGEDVETTPQKGEPEL
ncbi:MAG TPA: YihY/virulence factor BrkB family protein [Sphingomicrobium sp.]|nr:YihY/virulence factor BrkB family protein [Sphingomicrobium sp.]